MFGEHYYKNNINTDAFNCKCVLNITPASVLSVVNMGLLQSTHQYACALLSDVGSREFSPLQLEELWHQLEPEGDTFSLQVVLQGHVGGEGEVGFILGVKLLP